MVVWVASDIGEENLIESWVGTEIDPGQIILKKEAPEPYRGIEIPEEWTVHFPSGKAVFNYVLKQLPATEWKGSSDELLLERRKFEFRLFKLIEEELVLPRIKIGFNNVADFIKYANAVTNRRKARTGHSLELNLEAIFNERRLLFETQVITENRKKPDFIFPSGKSYHDPGFPSDQLQMMAAKTCCKDRWRQVINEADRISEKHLFTLQEGVSPSQLKEMGDSGVHLVVPAPHLKKFQANSRETLMTLEGFLRFIKKKQQGLIRTING